MATKTLPRRGFGLSRRWIAGIVLIIVIGAVALSVMNPRSTSQVSAENTVVVTRGSIVGSVSGSGLVTAEQTSDLAFQTSGTVTQILVKAGDTVTPGQVLARLDDRAWQAQVANAQAALDSAKARLQQAQQGNAKPEDIAAAQAQLDQVQANYNKTVAGPSAADLAAAEASVSSAQAAYYSAVIAAQTSSSTLESLRAVLLKAQVALEYAQSAYDRVAWRSDIGMLPQSKDLQQATIDYAKAKSDYEALLKTSGPDAQSKIQSAQTQLQQARANLAKLTVNPNDVASAQASVDQAKANLAKLTASATATDLSIQQANVQQAEQSLKQAQLNLENASLRAPFGGILTSVNVTEGSTVSPALAALRLINRNPLHVNLKLSENDIVKVQMDQPVNLTIDSLTDWRAQGKVSYISPAAESTNGVATYALQVNFADSDPRVKVGMTTNVDIVTARKDTVLLVPNAALLPKGNGHIVQVVGPDGKIKEVDVVTGISDGAQSEIVSGLNEGDRIVGLPGTNARSNNPFAPAQ